LSPGVYAEACGNAFKPKRAEEDLKKTREEEPKNRKKEPKERAAKKKKPEKAKITKMGGKKWHV
jgi:hypothetical protein